MDDDEGGKSGGDGDVEETSDKDGDSDGDSDEDDSDDDEDEGPPMTCERCWSIFLQIRQLDCQA